MNLEAIKKIVLPYNVMQQNTNSIGDINPKGKLVFELLNSGYSGSSIRNQSSIYDIIKTVYKSLYSEETVLSLQESTSAINSTSTLVTSIKYNSLLNVFVETLSGTTELIPINVNDFQNTTRNESRLIDGNLSNVVRNQNIAALNNSPMAALDMGGIVNVGFMDVYWIDPQRLPDTFKIQSSNDGITWTDITSILTPIFDVTVPTTSQRIPINNTGRFYRIFIVSTSNEELQWRLSEIRLYSNATINTYKLLSDVDGIVITKDENDNVIIDNKTNDLITTKLFYLQ